MIRGYIVVRHKLGIEHCMIHIELVNCLGGSAPCLKSVHRSIERSQTRRELVEDIYRIGRLRTGTSKPISLVFMALFRRIAKNLMVLSQANKVDGRSA